MAVMRQTIEIETKSGGVETVVAGLADFIAMERKFEIGTSRLEFDQRLDYIAFLAWSALRRSRSGVLGYDRWIEDELLDVTAKDDDEDEPAGKAEAATST